MRTLAVQTKNLSKTYGAVESVKSLNLDVETGEIFGLLGHNGAGKTTTVTMLTTLLEPSNGSATIGGDSVINDPDSVRRIIGYLPENVQFKVD